MSIIQEIPQKIHGKSKRDFTWLDLVFLFLLTAYILAGIILVPFHGDESTYILTSEDYDRIVKQDRITHVLFNPAGNPKQYLRLTTGSILTYSIGLVRDITNNDDPMRKWLWGGTWEDNIRMGNMPERGILTLARACSSIMGAIGIALFFFTARQLFPSQLIAWSATLILASRGDILVNIRRAMQEGPKFLFLILTIYFASRVLQALKDGATLRYPYALLGISSGFTLAAKQDVAPMLVALYLALALIPIWKKADLRAILINFFYLGLATCLAFAFFLALMPVFWGWWESVLALIGLVTLLFQLPVWRRERTALPLALAGCLLMIGATMISPTLWGKLMDPVVSMVQIRKPRASNKLEYYASKSIFTPEVAKDRLSFLLENTVSSKVMYMEVSSFDVAPFHKQITAYESSFLSGRTGAPLADGLVLLLAVVGAWWLLRRFEAESLLVSSMFLTTAVLLFIIVPVFWQRYFLIMQIPYSLIAGIGLNQIWIWGKNFSGITQTQQQAI